jgi:DNA-binding protein H-NS
MVDCIVKCCQKNKNVTKNAERHVDEESNKVATQYKRKLLKAKEWYIKNREDVIERTREYKDRMTPFEKTRERICQLLNASPDYAQKIRERTKQKYNFYYDNNIKRWTWEGRN